MHAAKCCTKFVAYENKNWAKITLVTIFYFKNLPIVCHAADGRGIERLGLRHM